MLIRSVDYLFEAIKIINPNDAFSKTEEKLAWQNALSAAESSMEILRIVLPFLTACSQWTQVLSQKAEVTVSLVGVACKSLKKQVLAIEKVSTDMSMSIPSRQILTDLVEELKSNFSKYFSEQYLKFWIFEVGAFLDTRTYHTMAFADKRRILEDILPSLVSKDEDTEPPVLSGRNQRNLSEEERFIAEKTGAQVRGSTPLQREWVVYNRLATSFKGENPLKFWSMHSKDLPILARIARRILCVPVTSSQVERLFSASGRICTFDRARLKPMNVDILTSLHVWYTLDLLDKTTTAKQHTAKGHRFASFYIDEMDDHIVEAVIPGISDDDDDEGSEEWEDEI